MLTPFVIHGILFLTKEVNMSSCLVLVIDTEHPQASEELAKLLAEVALDNYDCQIVGYKIVDDFPTIDLDPIEFPSFPT